MRTKMPPPVLGVEELHLFASIDGIAETIATQALSLEPADAQDYIDSELARTAVRMRRYERKGAAGAAAVGFAIDKCIRERIKARLAERRPVSED